MHVAREGDAAIAEENGVHDGITPMIVREVGKVRQEACR
jgi:hypothetical protein